MTSGDTDSPTTEIDAESPENVLEEIERKRSLRGWSLVALAVVGITFSLYQIWLAARGFTFGIIIPGIGEYRFISLQQLQIRAIHVNFGLIMAYLLYPTSDGTGIIARTLGRLIARIQNVVDNTSLAAILAQIQAIGRWLFIDPDRDRVTPADGFLIGLSVLPTLYYITQYDEITDVVRRFGLGQAAPLGELFPPLAPVAVGPLATSSFAYLMGVLAILLVLEATRRALGLLLTSLVSLFIVYGRFGYLIPRDSPGIGLLATSQLRWDQVVQNLWYTVEGILGIPVAVSVRFIYIFILFGAFLEMSGAGKWFIDLAYSLTGTRTGGPAKASVVSSGLMGMLSGSSVANTVTTGALTIPLMKRSGYSPEFAGAVESSASSGGQILPPVMGAAAFLIVEFIGVPYRTVIIAATLPALAFFFGMWMMVHLEAAKHGIGGLPRSRLLNLRPHLKRGWFYLVPLGLLLYYIVVARLSISRAGWLTIIATIALIALVAAYNRQTGPILATGILGLFSLVVATQMAAGTTPIGYLTGEQLTGRPFGAAIRAGVSELGLIITFVSSLILIARPAGDAPLLELDDAVTTAADRLDDHLNRAVASTRAGQFSTFIVKALDNGARTATVVVVAVAAAGVIPGIINLTGLGGSLRALILTVSGDSLVLLLVLTGIAAIIVGMGMPTTVMYIIIIVLLGPTIREFGIVLLAAHLFVLYLGLMADVTPPVAVAAYAASGIAKSDAFETGRLAFLLSLNKILVPFAFVFAPGIMFVKAGESVSEVLVLTATDLANISFLLGEVLIPIIGMFAGVYALGPAIIGYYRTSVNRYTRIGLGIAALALSVPALILLPTETLIGIFGIQMGLNTVSNAVLVRAAGGVLLVILLIYNRQVAARRSTKQATETANTP